MRLKCMVSLEATYSTECNTTLTTPGSNALTFVSICTILSTDNTFLTFFFSGMLSTKGRSIRRAVSGPKLG